MNKRCFDRSRVETAQRCPAQRWWAYEWGGTGLSPAVGRSELETGKATHVGLDLLGKGIALEAAIGEAVRTYRENVTGGVTVDFGAQQSPEEVKEEQAVLVEALLRGWAAIRLPRLREEFELLESESEYVHRFEKEDLTFLMRLDRLERRKADGLVFLRDFKTAAACDRRWSRTFPRNMQTLSMTIPVEAKHDVKVAGVIIEGLAKGKRLEYPEGSGRYQQNSPLLYAWKKNGAAPFPDEWRSRYAWTCTEPHEMSRGKACPGGAQHKLSGFYKAAVWREYPGGVRGWVDYLLEHDRELVEQQFVVLPPILRTDYDIEEWLRSTLAQEAGLAHKAEMLLQIERGESPVPAEQAPLYRQVYFPKHTAGGHNCSYCSYEQLCWSPQGIDPLAAGEFVRRDPNHPAENEGGVE